MGIYVFGDWRISRSGAHFGVAKALLFLFSSKSHAPGGITLNAGRHRPKTFQLKRPFGLAAARVALAVCLVAVAGYGCGDTDPDPTRTPMSVRETGTVLAGAENPANWILA